MTNTGKIEAVITKLFPSNKEGLKEFIKLFETKRLNKGDIILAPDSIDLNLKFVETGIIREYYLNKSKEININFYFESQFATDMQSYYFSKKTKKWQQCLTDVTIKELPFSRFEKFIKKYDCAKSAIQTSIQGLLMKKEALEYNRLMKDPQQQYSELVNQKQKWIKHIPQYHIASYLNITPETLSRIRKRLS